MKGRVVGMILFSTILLLFLFNSCANIDPHTKIDYDPTHKFTPFMPVNYTAMVKRTFNLDRKEISKQNDPKIQAEITDNVNTIKYFEGSKTLEFHKGQLPKGTHKNWDECFYSKKCIALVNIVKKKGGKPKISRKLRLGFSAIILDNRDTITYSDSSHTFEFKKGKAPKKIKKDWDKCFYTSNKTHGMLKSTKTGGYRLFYIDKNQHVKHFDFVRNFWLLKSTKKAIYRIWYVDKERHIQSFDYLPTKNLICADLTKAYANVRKQQGKEIDKTLLLDLVKAYTGFGKTSYYSNPSSTYSGVYNDSFGTGTWKGYGTSKFNAYSRIYDYSYIGYRAGDLLDTIFSGSASIEQIESALKEHGCKCP